MALSLEATQSPFSKLRADYFKELKGIDRDYRKAVAPFQETIHAAKEERARRIGDAYTRFCRDAKRIEEEG